jgi:calcineurin-like phosphoesterase family protein
VARLWTADLHFGHANILRYSHRPFADVAEMDDGLVARWNAVVGDDDEVWVLGDVAMGPIVRSLEHVARLRGRKVLVAGNHDRCWYGHGERAVAWIDRYLEAGFDEILQGTVGTEVGGIEVDVCHFPYEGDSHDRDRYTDHRPVDHGRWLIHGHVHERWQVHGRQVNVGVDVWDWAPVPEGELVRTIADQR